VNVLPQVRRGQAADMPSVMALLQSAGLPTEDLPRIEGLRTWVIGSKDAIRGVIALEPIGGEGLLRSLVVAPDYRNQGLARALVTQLEMDARAEGVTRLVLLTQTAADFFRGMGYHTIDRSDVSDLMSQCAQFRSLCPASAICMAKMVNDPMANRPYNVLFLCTGNSARSILAESLLNRCGQGRFRGYSAGSHPKGTVHPMALGLLEQMKLPTAGLRSKPWDEFAAPDAPAIDFVITVCDNAAGEVCPIWPGHPTKAHWGVPDPAAVEGSDSQKRAAFRDALRVLENRIQLFVSCRLLRSIT